MDTTRERAVLGSVIAAPGKEMPANLKRLIHTAPESFRDGPLGKVAVAVRHAMTNGHAPTLAEIGAQLDSDQFPVIPGMENHALPLEFAEIEAERLLANYHARQVCALLAEASQVAKENPQKAALVARDAAAALQSLATETPDTTCAQTDLRAAYDSATCAANKLGEVKIPPREPIVGNWLKEGDLGFLYGARGLGKTWLAMLLARRIAEGVTIGDWTVLKPRRVLYVDGEMPLDGIRERDAALSLVPEANISYLQHEVLFQTTGKVLNLTDPAAQAALLAKCQREKIEVLFLDNLSCLFSGINENDADAWEQVLPWLLDLRRHRIAVVFIAHAGRNGFMRGTSRREDAAFWIIQLAEAKDATEIQTGAKFVARFVKNRNATETECPPLEWSFRLAPNEARAHVSWKKLSTAQCFRQCVENGLASATDIAGEMGITKGQVSKLAKRGMAEGWLAKDGREYKLACAA